MAGVWPRTRVTGRRLARPARATLCQWSPLTQPNEQPTPTLGIERHHACCVAVGTAVVMRRSAAKMIVHDFTLARRAALADAVIRRRRRSSWSTARSPIADTPRAAADRPPLGCRRSPGKGVPNGRTLARFCHQQHPPTTELTIDGRSSTAGLRLQGLPYDHGGVHRGRHRDPWAVAGRGSPASRAKRSVSWSPPALCGRAASDGVSTVVWHQTAAIDAVLCERGGSRVEDWRAVRHSGVRCGTGARRRSARRWGVAVAPHIGWGAALLE